MWSRSRLAKYLVIFIVPGVQMHWKVHGDVLLSRAADIRAGCLGLSQSIIMYKIFAHLLSGRLAPKLESAQCPDQAGFKKNVSTIHHLLTAALLIEKAQE